MAKIDELKLRLNRFVENGGSLEEISKQDKDTLREIKNWEPKDENGRRLSLQEKFALLGHERKPQRTESSIDKMVQMVDEYVANGGKVEDLKRADPLYEYIHGVHLRDESGKSLKMEDKFALIDAKRKAKHKDEEGKYVSVERKAKLSENVKQDLIDAIDAYVASGKSFHVRRKSLPFYEKLRTYVNFLKRTDPNVAEDISSESVMKSLGYKNYSDLYYSFGEIDDIAKFKDKDGFVDAYRNSKLKEKINRFAQMTNLPIAVVVGVFADQNLKRNHLSTDYFAFVKTKLENYAEEFEDFKNLSTEDPSLYSRVVHLRNYVATETGETVSMDDLIDVLQIDIKGNNFRSNRRSGVDFEYIMKNVQEIAEMQNGTVRKKDLPRSFYFQVIAMSAKLGITTRAFFKSYDIDYIDGRNVDRLKNVVVKNYPYLQEMRARRDELMLLSGVSEENGCCKEEVFEKRLQVCLQVYDELKDKIFYAYETLDMIENNASATKSTTKYEMSTANPVKDGATYKALRTEEISK